MSDEDNNVVVRVKNLKKYFLLHTGMFKFIGEPIYVKAVDGLRF